MHIQKRIVKDHLSNWWYLGVVAVLVVAIGLVLANLIKPVAAYGSDDFAFTVKTDNAGTSAATEFTIPTDDGYGYNYSVDCDGDGVIDHANVIDSDVTCTYPSAGTYTVAISGDFPKIKFDDGGDKLKIIDIKQWGAMEWTSMGQSFKGAANLTSSATDAPDLSNATNMYQAFMGATSFNADTSNWDVSNIEIMAMTFYQATAFNGDVTNWNTSSVNNMSIMFCGATNFDGDVSNWDVSNVLYMDSLFCDTDKFNSDLSGWNTSKVVDMDCMFCGAASFSGDISTWDVSNVTSMEAMFDSATSFDGDLSQWQPLALENAVRMFDYSGLSKTNYHRLLAAWSELANLPSDIDFGVYGLSYYDGGIDARQKLIDDFGWTFIGDIYTNYEFNPLPPADNDDDDGGSSDGSDGGTTGGPGTSNGGSDNGNTGSTGSGSNDNGSGNGSGPGSGGSTGGGDSGSTTPPAGNGSDGGSSDGSTAPHRAKLIKLGWDIPSVSYVADHVSDMENLPFDGVVMALDDRDLLQKVFSPNPLDYNEVYAAMSAIKDTNFDTMKHNFIALYVAPVGDLDNEAAWNTAAANLGKFAKAAKLSGFEGIMLDDEAYFGDVVKYGETCDDAIYTVSQCQALARQRGYEVMQSMQANWTDLTLLVLNGPTLGDDHTAAFYLSHGVDWDNSGADSLMGAFNVGLVASTINQPAQYVDGGEIYSARTKQQFSAVRQWSKYDFPMNSSYVPSNIKSDWSKNMSSSFGIYQDDDDPGYEFTPETWKSTLINAMTYADDYVWAYTEQYDWWGAPDMWNPAPSTPIPSAWVDATRQAINSFD